MSRLASLLALLCFLGATLAFAPGQSAVPIYVALGDSITQGQFATRTSGTEYPALFKAGTIDGKGYADLVARSLGSAAGIRFQNLGTGGAYAFTVWDIELPKIDRNATVVTLFIGVNDEIVIAGNGKFSSGSLVFNATMEYWRAAIQNIVDGVRRAAPSARLVIANVPNLADYPAFQPNPPTAGESDRQRALTRTTDAMDRTIDALADHGVIVVDLRCDPNVYRKEYFANEVHPNDVGYRYLAQRFLEALRRPARPRASCPPFTGQDSG